MNRTIVGLGVFVSFVGMVATAQARPAPGAVTSLVRGVIAEGRDRGPDPHPFEAIELGGARLIANSRTARIVRREKVLGREGGMVGNWAEVKVIPLDRHMHDVAEGDQRLMHRQHGVWRSVAFTDEANGFKQSDLRRAHVPATVVRSLHLDVQDRR